MVCIRRRRYTFWNHPVLLQDWDERQSERRPAWIELFYDLVYVAAAIQLGLFLKEDRTFAAVALFCSLVVILWFTWFQLNIYMSRFYSDSVVFKLFYSLLHVRYHFDHIKRSRTSTEKLRSGHCRRRDGDSVYLVRNLHCSVCKSTKSPGSNALLFEWLCGSCNMRLRDADCVSICVR